MMKKTHSGPAAQVVAKFARRYFPYDTQLLITAASASGKSYIASGPTGAYLGLLDGDNAVADVLGWPVHADLRGDLYDPEARAAGESVLTTSGLAHYLNALAVRAYTAHGQYIGLFNGGLLRAPNTILVGVEIPEKQYRSQWEAWRVTRRAKQSSRPRPRKVSDLWHEQPFSAFLGNRASIRRQVDEELMFEDFETAAHFLRFAGVIRKLMMVPTMVEWARSSPSPVDALHARVLPWMLRFFDVIFEEPEDLNDYSLIVDPGRGIVHIPLGAFRHVLRGTSVRIFDFEGTSDFIGTLGLELRPYHTELVSWLNRMDRGETPIVSDIANLLTSVTHLLEN